MQILSQKLTDSIDPGHPNNREAPLVYMWKCNYTLLQNSMSIPKAFLAAKSSSRSLVVSPLVGPLVGDVCEIVTFRVSKGK